MFSTWTNRNCGLRSLRETLNWACLPTKWLSRNGCEWGYLVNISCLWVQMIISGRWAAPALVVLAAKYTWIWVSTWTLIHPSADLVTPVSVFLRSGTLSLWSMSAQPRVHLFLCHSAILILVWAWSAWR